MFKFFKSKFSKLKSNLAKKLKGIFSKPLDESSIEELEQLLYEADLGSELVEEFIDEIETFHKQNPKATFEKFLEEMKRSAMMRLSFDTREKPLENHPHVILVVGVNGSGKTTSVAKLAAKYRSKGKKVLIAAGDTFRAAAIEQLEHWAHKTGVDIVSSMMGADPSSVIYDALEKAKAGNYDVVIADTAGRLESKTDLMKELQKIKRVCMKVIPSAPHETLLVVDATMGQTVIEQGKVFHEFTPLSGIVLTKLDGSAKGGIALAVYKQLKLPIKWVGLGESADDFIAFDAKEYVNALFSV